MKKNYKPKKPVIRITKKKKKKICSSEIPTRDLFSRSTVPITMQPNFNFRSAAQNKVYKDMKISCCYYIISISNYEKLTVSCVFLLGLHVFNVSVITANDIYDVVGRDIRKAIYKHGMRSVE